MYTNCTNGVTQNTRIYLENAEDINSVTGKLYTLLQYHSTYCESPYV